MFLTSFTVWSSFLVALWNNKSVIFPNYSLWNKIILVVINSYFPKICVEFFETNKTQWNSNKILNVNHPDVSSHFLHLLGEKTALWFKGPPGECDCSLPGVWEAFRHADTLSTLVYQDNPRGKHRRQAPPSQPSKSPSKSGGTFQPRCNWAIKPDSSLPPFRTRHVGGGALTRRFQLNQENIVVKKRS